MKDLEFPKHARNSINSLIDGLRYDAAIGTCGSVIAKIPIDFNDKAFHLGVRHGGGDEDVAVFRDITPLLCRLSLISMVSRLELHAQNLLLQRRVIEEIGPSRERMDGEKLWPIIRRVNLEARKGPVKLCSQLVVTKPTTELSDRMVWLEGIYRVRNCLAHRLGKVGLPDVRLPEQEWEQIENEQTLRCKWLKGLVYSDGKPVQSYPFIAGEKTELKFEEYTKEWKIGDTIEITPDDCQAISFSLTWLAEILLQCFENEMWPLLN